MNTTTTKLTIKKFTCCARLSGAYIYEISRRSGAEKNKCSLDVAQNLFHLQESEFGEPNPNVNFCNI